MPTVSAGGLKVDINTNTTFIHTHGRLPRIGLPLMSQQVQNAEGKMDGPFTQR